MYNTGESYLCKYPNAACNFFLTFKPKIPDSVIKVNCTFMCRIPMSITNVLNSVHILQIIIHLKTFFDFVIFKFTFINSYICTWTHTHIYMSIWGREKREREKMCVYVVYMCTWVHGLVQTWRSEDNFWEAFLSPFVFWELNSSHQVGSKFFDPLSHVCGPLFSSRRDKEGTIRHLSFHNAMFV